MKLVKNNNPIFEGMRNTLLYFLFIVMFQSRVSAQLDQIPRLWSDFRGSQADSVALSNVLLLLNTKDFGQLRSGAQTTPERTTVQVINTAYPSIPKCFIQGSNSDFFHTTSGSYQTDFYTAANINANNTFSYCRFETHSAGNTCDTSMVSIDMSTLSLRKVLHSSDIHIPGVSALAIDGHDYQVDAQGRQLLPILVDTVMNTSCLPGGRLIDTVAIGWIVLLDSNNNLIWAWNPLDHGYNICEARYTIRNADSTLDWSHCNSARFGFNGNIQVSFREVGVFEFDPTTGDVVFKLGGLDTLSPVYIPIPDSADYYFQHDWMQVDSTHYSVFSDGIGSQAYLEGHTYYVRRDSMIARLVDRVLPVSSQTAIAMGSYRKTLSSPFTPKVYSILDHGVTYQDYFSGTGYTQLADIEDSAGNIIEELDGPSLQIPYRIEQTTWQIPNRPTVYVSGTELMDSTPNLYGYRWYQIFDTAIRVVDTISGSHYTPVANGMYCLEALFNTDSIIIHMVSDPIQYPAATGIRNINVENDIFHIYPDPFDQRLNIQVSNDEYFEIISLCGQSIMSGYLKSGNNEINTQDLDAGLYFIRISGSDHLAKVVKIMSK